MTPQLPVRRLQIDLSTPLPRHWAGGDAFRTALFNALSMSFPNGEQFFIDSVRAGAARLPQPERQAMAAEIQGFAGQEATHRHLHAQFNARLAEQGHVDTWGPRILRRAAFLAGADPRHAVAITAANEHFTALLAEQLLTSPHWLQGAEQRLVDFWQWHAAEELEHRTTAFDLYQRLGGSLKWRRRWMLQVTLFLASDTLRQTLRNLHSDGTLWRPSTWWSAAGFLLGRSGLAWALWRPWLRYFRRDFHPAQHGHAAGQAWLLAHSAQYRVVGTGGAHATGKALPAADLGQAQSA